MQEVVEVKYVGVNAIFQSEDDKEKGLMILMEFWYTATFYR